MKLSEERKGELYVFLAMIFTAFFPIVTILSLKSIPPLFALGWSTIFTAMFFAIAIGYQRRWNELRDPNLWRHMIFVTFFISIALYGLFFSGLKYTSAGNGAIINLFAVFTSFLFFNVLRREPISFEYMAGAAFMVIGAIVVLAHGFTGINIGDLLILGAMFFAPLGNFYQQKARKIASSETIMFVRSLLAAPFLFLIGYLLGEQLTVGELKTALPFLLINGVLILGLSKIFWIEGIHRILVTKAEAINSAAPIFTLLFAFLLLGQQPDVWQFVSLPIFILGVLLLTDQIRFKKTLTT